MIEGKKEGRPIIVKIYCNFIDRWFHKLLLSSRNGTEQCV
jgi:hypothetical protein